MQYTAEILKQLRAIKGTHEGRKITQHIMAQELNLSRGTISSWEVEGGGVKKSGDVKLIEDYFKNEIPVLQDIQNNKGNIRDDDNPYLTKSLSAKLLRKAREIKELFLSPDNVPKLNSDDLEAAAEFERTVEKLARIAKHIEQSSQSEDNNENK